MDKKKERRNKQWEIVFRLKQYKKDGRKHSIPDRPKDHRKLFHFLIESNHEADMKIGSRHHRPTYPISDRDNNYGKILLLIRDVEEILRIKGSAMGFEIVEDESGIREEGRNLHCERKRWGI